MMLRAEYNMFEDILFGLVVGVILGLCVMTRRASLLFADVIGLWKVRPRPSQECPCRIIHHMLIL